MHPVNALADNFIKIHDLEAFSSSAIDEQSVNGDTASTPMKAAPKEVAKKAPEPSAEISTGPSCTQLPTKLLSKKKLVDDVVEQAIEMSTETSDKPKMRSASTSRKKSIRQRKRPSEEGPQKEGI